MKQMRIVPILHGFSETKRFKWIIFASVLVFSGMVWAAYTPVGGVRIGRVLVNGGSDTLNPGVSCIQLKPMVPVCEGGWIGIPNNNKLLLAAAMQAKATNASVMVEYENAASAKLHCPYSVFTSCSLLNIHLE